MWTDVLWQSWWWRAHGLPTPSFPHLPDILLRKLRSQFEHKLSVLSYFLQLRQPTENTWLLKFPMPKAFLPCCMVENIECDVCMYMCIYVCWSAVVATNHMGFLGGKQFPSADNLCTINCVEIRWLSISYNDTDHMLYIFSK